MPIGTWFRGTAADGAAAWVEPPAPGPAPAPAPGPAPAPTPAPIVLPPEVWAIGPGIAPRIVRGSGEIGALISLYLDDVLYGTATVDGFGEWALSVTEDPATYGMTVTQLYQGETSAATGPISLVILMDLAPPPSTGHSGRDILNSGDGGLPDPPITAGDPREVGSIDRPFRTPKGWHRRGRH